MTATKQAKKPAQKASPKAKSGLYAIFTTGGKQYRVHEGDKLKIEKIIGPSTSSGQAIYKEGDKITFSDVLLTDNGAGEVTLGKPYIDGGKVIATLNKIGRYKTVDVIKYKQKSRYFKKYGHRQPYFEIIVDSIK